MMMKHLLLGLAMIAAAGAVQAAEGIEIPHRDDWSFKGIRADWDKDEIYRGYTVATQVCMACHSFKYISHRDLMRVGFTENEVKTLAAAMNMGMDDKLITALAPADAQETYGKVPPDLSLMNKARHGGADYVSALLHGYSEDPTVIAKYMPAGVAEGAHFNLYFPGHNIAMPNPVAGDGLVTYHDGKTASRDQMIHDVSTFMEWTAEPEKMDRQRLGVYVLIYLGIFVVLAWLTKRAIWQDVPH